MVLSHTSLTLQAGDAADLVFQVVGADEEISRVEVIDTMIDNVIVDFGFYNDGGYLSVSNVEVTGSEIFDSLIAVWVSTGDLEVDGFQVRDSGITVRGIPLKCSNEDHIHFSTC